MHPAGEQYLKWFHESNVWKHMSYCGVRTLKLPSDMWSYQEIIIERGVEWVIETGSRHGGSALFFADVLRNAARGGKVISIDLTPALDPRARRDNLLFLTADSATPEIVQQVEVMLPEQRGPLFLILDSDHTAAHVRRELEVWVPFLKSGDYLLVEDTVVNGHPVRPEHGPGPLEAVRGYLADHSGSLQRDIAREEKFGATLAPEGYYLKT